VSLQSSCLRLCVLGCVVFVKFGAQVRFVAIGVAIAVAAELRLFVLVPILDAVSIVMPVNAQWPLRVCRQEGIHGDRF
jgi:hypothetical protein